MARLGRRNWIRLQGRANAALLLLSRDMGATFVPPADEGHFAVVQGRTHGCTFDLHVADRRDDPALMLTIRHFHSQSTRALDGDGLRPPDLDPDTVRAAIEAACYEFATQH